MISKKIRDLFYDPKTDSITVLLKSIKNTHAKILQQTDLEKGTLSPQKTSYKSLMQDFKIPRKGLSKGFFPQFIANLFRSSPRWHSPRTMYNVVPSPLIQTVVGKTFASLYNPNLLWDTAAGTSGLTEQLVIKAVAEYVGWDWLSAGGSFTFGGKATTMYGIKLGVRKCSADSAQRGMKDNIVVLSTKACHPSHISDAEWLGIGSSNLIRLNTNANSQVNLEDMERVIRKITAEGKKVATIIISGGTTNNMVVDPIKEVVLLRDKLASELGLSYKPHVHVDSVVGFPWIFFKDYNIDANPLNMGTEVKEKISTIIKDLRDLNYADSFGVDFHKMGFCPYISSLFMIKDKSLFYDGKDNFVDFGQYTPFAYTIENSRPGDGPISAYIALNVLGVEGFQILIAHFTEMATNLQHLLEKTGQFEIISKTGLGSAVVFVPQIPDDIKFLDTEQEKTTRNAYTKTYLDTLRQLDNPYYLDMVPEYSTGATVYPFRALKAYIISPYADKKTNAQFVTFMVTLKTKIDKSFDFGKKNKKTSPIKFVHPLK